MADLLDPGPAARAGAAFGQLATRLEHGGLLLSAARLVEVNCRATILIAPGLFRFDLTPLQETLGVAPRPLGDHSLRWEAQESSWDSYREPSSREAPLELRGVIDIPGDPLLAWVHVLSFNDRDAGAVHFIAKCEIRRPTS
jgi:hypothetical protein